MMRIRTLSFLLLMSVFSVFAQDIDWSVKIIDENTDHPALQLTAKVPSGGHFYSIDNPQGAGGGANPLSIAVTPVEGCELVGGVKANKSPITEYDDVFKMDQRYYTGTVVFTQALKATAPQFKVKVKVKGQFCIGTSCMQTRLTQELAGKGVVKAAQTPTQAAPAATQPAASKQDAKNMPPANNPAAQAILKNTDKNKPLAAVTEVEVTETDTPQPIEEVMEEEMAEETQMIPEAESDTLVEEALVADALTDTWGNVENQIAEFKAGKNGDRGVDLNLWGIFFAGFLAGFLALLTPCVWPMIPMTVSFFLKQNKSRGKSIRTAALYGLSIIFIYVLIGLLVTGIFGATALNQLATSAVFNLIFFALLVIFAISFLGGFEMTLPSKWTNKMDDMAGNTSGLLSIFFMAFTLSLVSFSCTGPLIGTLLVEAASSGSFLSPALGMFGFALALAIPFTLFAIFPSWLKSMPKSGGWLNSVKVVLGFLELALALKFLSVADMAYHWRILDREVFIALWIVIFALLGVYLLGKLRFPHDGEKEHTGVFPFMLSLISFAFAVYMIPGLWGAPLKAISAFAPPMNTQDFSLYKGEVTPHTDDYDAALQLGARENKPVIVDFSGYGCVNCRKMEGSVWTNDEIRNMIDDNFVVTTLYVDDKRELPQPIEMKNRKGQTETIEDYGELWSFLQENKFGAVAQPYHVILDSNGMPLTYPQDFTESAETYKKFLQSALDNYNNRQ